MASQVFKGILGTIELHDFWTFVPENFGGFSSKLSDFRSSPISLWLSFSCLWWSYHHSDVVLFKDKYNYYLIKSVFSFEFLWERGNSSSRPGMCLRSPSSIMFHFWCRVSHCSSRTVTWSQSLLSLRISSSAGCYTVCICIYIYMCVFVHIFFLWTAVISNLFVYNFICIHAHIFVYIIYTHPILSLPLPLKNHRLRVAKATEQKAKIESHGEFLDSSSSGGWPHLFGGQKGGIFVLMKDDWCLCLPDLEWN